MFKSTWTGQWIRERLLLRPHANIRGNLATAMLSPIAHRGEFERIKVAAPIACWVQLGDYGGDEVREESHRVMPTAVSFQPPVRRRVLATPEVPARSAAFALVLITHPTSQAENLAIDDVRTVVDKFAPSYGCELKERCPCAACPRLHLQVR